MFENQVQQHPHAIAISCGEDRLTYAEINAHANQLAHHLITLGVRTDVLVGLHITRSIDAIVAMLAILKAGGAYVPLDPAYPQDRLVYIVVDSKLTLVITNKDMQSNLNPRLAGYGVNTVFMDAAQKNICSSPTTNPDVAISPSDLMYVIYTSGSTGNPKGVMVTHANVTRLFQATKPYLHFDENDAWTLFHSYSFGFSVWEIWGALTHGAKLVVVPSDISQSPDDFYKLVHQEEITVLSQTPSAFGMFQLADAALNQPYNLNLRYIIFSGEPLESSLLEAWIQRHGDERPQLINMYAITETAGEITYHRLRKEQLSGSARHVIGIPLPDVRIYLLDINKQHVPKGDAGEMYISSVAIARGYLNLDELSSQRFLPDPFFADGKTQMYKTGDQARYLPNGEIEFLGRNDDQVKIRGYRVELTEIQSLLYKHSDIQEAVVIAQTGAANTTRLVAYIISPAELSAAKLQDYLSASLPDYMIPSSFVQLDRLPYLPNGKVDRQALLLSTETTSAHSTTGYIAQTDDEKALADLWNINAVATTSTQGTLLQSRSYVAPQTSVEQTVADIWGEFLSYTSIGLHDDFFGLGGNSLLAAQILYRVNSEFTVNLSMRQLLDNGTVFGIATLIEQKQSAQTDTDDLNDLMIELETLSAEEIQALLAEQSNTPAAGPDSDQAVRGSTIEDEGYQDANYMRMTIDKALEGVGNNQNAVAACIVKNGKVIACVHNAVLQHKDVTAHAEMLAIREACRQLDTIDLAGCVLYCTLEPCPMCFSASHWANIDKIVYGARREDAMRFGLGGHAIPVDAIKKLGDSPIKLTKDILREENIKVFEVWFGKKTASYTQYDDIAEQFKQIKNSPVNKFITDHTFFTMVGDLDKGKTVLDLACGEGHSCRTLKQHGADSVVGVDISLEMIRLARQQETAHHLGIEYICQDVMELGKVGEFDLVVASFLLNYAQTKEQLVKMCQVAFDNLKPGGHFILINENVEQSPDNYQGYERYGYTKTIAEPWQEGSVITYTMSTGTEELQFKGYYWSKETCLQAFNTAGFNAIQWQNLSCSPQGIETYGYKFWQNFLVNPPFIGIIAERKKEDVI